MLIFFSLIMFFSPNFPVFLNYVSVWFFLKFRSLRQLLIQINSCNTPLWSFTRKSLHCCFSLSRPVKITYKFIHVQFGCLSFLKRLLDYGSQLNMTKTFLRWWYNRKWKQLRNSRKKKVEWKIDLFQVSLD